MNFKSSVCLVVLAIVILYCVHGGVAGQHREECVKKEEPESQNICDINDNRFKKGFVICLRSVCVKTVWIYHNNLRPRYYLPPKPFFHLSYALVGIVRT